MLAINAKRMDVAIVKEYMTGLNFKGGCKFEIEKIECREIVEIERMV